MKNNHAVIYIIKANFCFLFSGQACIPPCGSGRAASCLREYEKRNERFKKKRREKKKKKRTAFIQVLTFNILFRCLYFLSIEWLTRVASKFVATICYRNFFFGDFLIPIIISSTPYFFDFQAYLKAKLPSWSLAYKFISSLNDYFINLPKSRSNSKFCTRNLNFLK